MAPRATRRSRLRRGKTIVHQEARTFAHRTAAITWAKHREVALEDPSALTRVHQGSPTLAELIRWYIDTFGTISKWQRSKQTHLEFLERHALGKAVCVGALRRASSKLRPKYFGATFAKGILASPNSANNPK